MLKQLNSKFPYKPYKSNSILTRLLKMKSDNISTTYKQHFQKDLIMLNQLKIFPTNIASALTFKSNHNSSSFYINSYKSYSTSNPTKKPRISDSNFLLDPNSNFLFQEKKLNKSLFIFYTLVHIPFYLVSINLGFGLNLFHIDMIRTGVKSLPLFQAIITGINISSIINKIQVKIENFQNNKNFDYDADEIKKEISDSEKMIVLSAVPVLINFVISQIFVNSIKISNEILLISSLGFMASNFLNLIILFYYVYNQSNLNPVKFSLIRINLIFALVSMICYLLIFNYLKKNENQMRNPLLTIDDENRIENLYTLNECVKEDTKLIQVEINELMDEITPEQIELMEKIFNDEESTEY